MHLEFHQQDLNLAYSPGSDFIDARLEILDSPGESLVEDIVAKYTWMSGTDL